MSLSEVKGCNDGSSSDHDTAGLSEESLDRILKAHDNEAQLDAAAGDEELFNAVGRTVDDSDSTTTLSSNIPDWSCSLGSTERKDYEEDLQALLYLQRSAIFKLLTNKRLWARLLALMRALIDLLVAEPKLIHHHIHETTLEFLRNHADDICIESLAQICGSCIPLSVMSFLESFLSGELQIDSVRRLFNEDDACPDQWYQFRWTVYCWIMVDPYSFYTDRPTALYAGYTSRPVERFLFHRLMIATLTENRLRYSSGRTYKSRTFLKFADCDALFQAVNDGKVSTMLTALILQLLEALGFLVWGGDLSQSPFVKPELQQLFKVCRTGSLELATPLRHLVTENPFSESTHSVSFLKAWFQAHISRRNSAINSTHGWGKFCADIKVWLPGVRGQKLIRDVANTENLSAQAGIKREQDVRFYTDDGKKRCTNAHNGSQCEASFKHSRSYAKHRLITCPNRKQNPRWTCKKDGSYTGECGQSFASKAALKWHQEDFCVYRPSLQELHINRAVKDWSSFLQDS